MNDDLDDFENELRELELRAPSRELEQRIATQLGRQAFNTGSQSWWQKLGFNRPFAALGWGILSPAVSAAVVVAFGQLAGTEHSSSPTRPPIAEEVGESATSLRVPPVSGFTRSALPVAAKATNVVYQALDEGVVLDSSQEPVRRVRYRSADLVEWRNPETGVNWAVSYPREDVVLVPIRAD